MRQKDAGHAGFESRHEELLSEIAHAFRTPLGVISGYVELLQLRDDPALRADALPRIEAAADRLGQQIDRLLIALEREPGVLVARLFGAPTGTAPPSFRAATPGQPRVSTAGMVKRIVIVDDDDEIRHLLLRTLPIDGFELLEARDGLDALAQLEQVTPDLVVLDWNMPNASGGEVLTELKRRGHDVPVIVLTADDDSRRREAAEAAGAAAFLAKPFSPLELLREIERLLELSPGESFGDEPA